ncbi:hypothetical protein RIF29_25400 [Crotalaria pallida]|uniref:Uncharacterized protein n=1 Tax=Crotalaria pallida TaxID=3830 RepID=A0AAN9ENX7_CROPI
MARTKMTARSAPPHTVHPANVRMERPGQQSPVQDSPGEQSPVQDPVAEQPPVQQPAVQDPVAEQPPIQQPADPPAEQPQAVEPDPAIRAGRLAPTASYYRKRKRGDVSSSSAQVVVPPPPSTAEHQVPPPSSPPPSSPVPLVAEAQIALPPPESAPVVAVAEVNHKSMLFSFVLFLSPSRFLFFFIEKITPSKTHLQRLVAISPPTLVQSKVALCCICTYKSRSLFHTEVTVWLLTEEGC